jgi:hypothetical protein
MKARMRTKIFPPEGSGAGTGMVIGCSTDKAASTVYLQLK